MHKSDECKKELEDLQKDFTEKVKSIRAKYFTENHQLVICPLVDKEFEIMFYIDYDALVSKKQLA